MQTLRKQAQSLLSQAVDTVLPPRCIVTGEPVEQQGMVNPAAWGLLDFVTDPFCKTCGIPFEYEFDGGSTCAECIDHPPPFETARAALRYNDSSRSIILSFKHADKTHLVRAFVPWLRRVGSDMLSDADILMPVPLHRWRLIGRRYNQAALIAQALSKATGIPSALDALVRTRATPSQGRLTFKERQRNVRRAFAMNPACVNDVKGKSVVLVDDVYTTGATVKECTKVLLKAGAARVDILTLARVVRPG